MDQTGLPAGFAAPTTEYPLLPAGGPALYAVSGGAAPACLLHPVTGRAEGGGLSPPAPPRSPRRSGG